MSLKHIVTEFNIFKGLSSEELDKVIPFCQLCAFNSGDTIIEEDVRRLNLYIILEGNVNIKINILYSKKNENESKRVATLKTGDIFGEMSLLERGREVAYVTAANNIRLIEIDGKKLIELLDSDNHIGFVIMRNLAAILSQKLHDLDIRLRDNNFWKYDYLK